MYQKPMQLSDFCKIILKYPYFKIFSTTSLSVLIVSQLKQKYFPIRLYQNNKTQYIDGFCVELLIRSENDIFISFIPLKKNVLVDESLTFRLMIFIFVCIAMEDKTINGEKIVISRRRLMETIYYQFRNNIHAKKRQLSFYEKFYGIFFRINRISDENVEKHKIKELFKLHINNIPNQPLKKFGLQKIYLDGEIFMSARN